MPSAALYNVVQDFCLFVWLRRAVRTVQCVCVCVCVRACGHTPCHPALICSAGSTVNHLILLYNRAAGAAECFMRAVCWGRQEGDIENDLSVTFFRTHRPGDIRPWKTALTVHSYLQFHSFFSLSLSRSLTPSFCLPSPPLQNMDL